MLMEFSTVGGANEAIILRYADFEPGGLETAARQMISSLRADPQLSALGPYDILLDVPQDKTTHELGADIDIDAPTIISLDKISEIVQALPREFEKSARRLRVFVSPALWSNLTKKPELRVRLSQSVSDYIMSEPRIV
jgi:hypothetical protein